jgi:uncharacterized protein YecT (DUF1311 family)
MMTSFIRELSDVTFPPAPLLVRRSAIALGGGACVAFAAVMLGSAARPQLHALTPAVDNRPTIIDGPPTNVQPAPPPVKPAPRVRQPPSELFADEDGDDYDDAADAGSVDTAPGQTPGETSQAPAQPSEPQPQAQWAQAQAQRARPGRCARLSSPADQMVCASPRLNAAEAALQRLYDMDLDRTWDPEALREDQRRWRAVRDQVAQQAGPDGLAEFYAERIQELDGPY